MQRSFSSSVIHLLAVMLILGFGGLIFLASFLVDMQGLAIHYLLLYPTLIRSIGAILAIGGLILCALFYQMHKGRYYQIKMGLVHEKIIRKYIQAYWHTLFPKDRLEVILHSNQILEIVVAKSIDPELLAKIELELGGVLLRKIGYRGQFLLTLR